jgi:hypothetical protein
MFISSEFFCFLMTITWIISTCLLLVYLRTHKEEVAENDGKRIRIGRRIRKREPKINNDNNDNESVDNV